MEIFNPKVFITGITGDLGAALYKQSLLNNLEVYGQSRTISSKNIIKNNFINLNLSEFESFFKDNDINCLINNAAMYSDTTFIDMKSEDIINMVNTNLTAPIILTKYFYDNLVKQNKFGILININSLAGKQPNYNEAIYCATKFGLSGFGSSLSINQKKSNIRIIDCYLGAMQTKITVNRKEYKNFMNTDEVAKFIFSLILNNSNCISSFELRNIK